MQETNQYKEHHLKVGVIAVWLAFAGQAMAASSLPGLGEDDSPWNVHTTYENHTVHRENAGLAKFRNTLQAEFDKRLGNDWTLQGTLRGTWDGVYRMNSDEYGKNAGGPVTIQNSGYAALPPVPTNAGTPLNLPNVPFGGGINNPIATALGLPPTNAFGFDLTRNPNQGMRVLGDRWHATEGGVGFGVPVRPCDYDKRGCKDFGGYGDKKLSELEAPEFNDRLDFIREVYTKKTFHLDGGEQLFVKVGKQQVVWGRTDLFRVLDVINPVDYSRNNIYDELSDIRIPMWIAQAEYRMGASDSMQDRNFQVVWNFDKFRPSNLGQCGTPNVMLDAGCLFRSMSNLWDNGGTVANFANGGTVATDFGPHQAGIRNVYLPEWSLSNTQLGVKYEGVSKDGLSFSLNALTYRSQLPSLRAINGNGTINPFTGVNGNTTPPYAGTPVSNLIAFDVHFPRVNLVGGSMDLQLEDLGAAVRLEAALTEGEEFANTARSQLYSKNNVFRSVIGVDRPTFIPLISTSTATLISAQLFYQHIFDHELRDGPLGRVGMPDWEDNYLGTLMIKGFLKNGTVSPQVVLARDFKAKAFAVAPQVEWNVSNDLKLTLGANYKGANGDEHYKFDDCRSCNPYGPFTNYAAGQPIGQSFGLGGVEPLGRFRAGPIGTAFKENDIYFKLNYKF
ncbi:MAG: hypothetical protein H6R10_98 [Rhodocyclaceae bacterium]|nr:hypothetical protein [Rhodocyclaceae bacterium]